MKFKNLFKWTKDDYNRTPDHIRYEEGWMHERMDEGPPSGKGKGLNIWRVIDLLSSIVVRMIK